MCWRLDPATGAARNVPGSAMSATNGVGYEIQVYNPIHGWIAEHTGFDSLASAQTVLAAMIPDGWSRRAYESLA